ncbi:lipase family protein [Aldersonia kunmingensis]|uniref:lipase family protein n=1 Tax=Aldersonia kunmingensis TaxID=408066 RepID=UPI0008304006|nr:lipase family protein [Aldersonia kunmingensis]
MTHSLVLTALAAAGALAIGSASTATAEEVPNLGQVFSPFVLSTLADAHIAPPENWFPRHPVDDPWYQAPTLKDDAKPGTLLKARPAQLQVYGVQPGKVRAWQLMYVTTDFDKSKTVSTGLLMVPEDGTKPADRKLIGYSEANDSLGAGCMPSTQWTGGDQTDPSLISALPPVAQMFGHGWAVMMSDTANDGDPNPHGFSVSQYSGPATLDGLRAAIAITDAGLPSDIPIGLYGIAGGGVAAGVAAEKQATYAPELNVVGTVLQAMVVEPASFERKADGGIGSGFVFANSLGYAAKYPEIDLDKELTPLGKAMADVFHETCQALYLGVPFVPLSALYKNGRPADNPVFERAYRENRMGQASPKAPVLMTSCRDDFLVPYADVEKLTATYRAGGTDVTVDPSHCAGLETLLNPYHAGADLLGMQDVEWLDKKFKETR